jgi:hypothetical protein
MAMIQYSLKRDCMYMIVRTMDKVWLCYEDLIYIYKKLEIHQALDQ